MLIVTRIRLVSTLATIALCVGFFAYTKADVVGVPEGLYGNILFRDDSSIKNVVIEHIALYPRKAAHSYEKIMRRAILFKRKNAKGTVLIAHGFMCTKEDVAFFRFLFPTCNCMTFDMRAHGQDIGNQYCTFGKNEAYDVMAAARFLRNHPDLKKKPLFVYGFSMGAVASIEAQAKDQSLFDGMILDCPWDASENLIKRGLEHMKFSLFGYEFSVPGRSLLQKYVFHPYVQSFVKATLKVLAHLTTKNIKTFIYPLYPAESIKKVSAPLLLIHCKNDEKVSVASIKKVYKNAASSYKKLWITNGRHHFDSFFYNPEAYARRVARFTKKLVSGMLSAKQKKRVVEDVGQKGVAVHINVSQTQIRRKR